MHVIATAGHVDHGKSTLLRALTGMEPDRLHEERERGLTIDLGFVWTEGAHGRLAFVDVPGHERFVANMLAGVGSVPAVLFVVAADEGWMPQSAEHLAALDALGARHGVIAVTKADLMEPELAAEEALEAVRRTTLSDMPAIPVSAITGEGIAQVREALDDLVANLPAGDPTAPVRLWVDRSFTVRGAGLVVTGTLADGTICAGDTLELARTGKSYAVRELQSLNEHVERAVGAARVALNLRGARRGDVGRGDALLTPGSYRPTSVVDARILSYRRTRLPREVLLHVGTATVSCAMRSFDGESVRFALRSPLPLRLGDRVVLRDGNGVAGGATVLDVDPPELDRKGAARRRAYELAGYSDSPDGASELRRRGIARAESLRAVGVEPPGAALVGDWLVDPELLESLRGRLAAMVRKHAADDSAAPLSVEDARRALDLPDTRLVSPLLLPPLVVRDGAIVHAEAPDTLAPKVRAAIDELARLLPAEGFVIPTEETLRVAGLGPAEVSAAVRAQRLVRLSPNVVVLPEAVERSVVWLARLPQPFTAGQAREVLDTNRKVAVPLLEHLARHGLTRRTQDGQHVIVDTPSPSRRR